MNEYINKNILTQYYKNGNFPQIHLKSRTSSNPNSVFHGLIDSKSHLEKCKEWLK